MTVLKRFGKVYGAVLTKDEQQAMNIEIKAESKRVFAEMARNHENEVDAVFLWWLHKKKGYGKKSLKEFYDDFEKEMDALAERYETEDGDQLWLCTALLKEYGIDLEEWRKEKDEQQKKKK